MRKLPFRNFLILSGERGIDFVARCAARLSPHSPWGSLQNCTTQRVDKSTTPVFYIPFVCKLICAIGDIKNKRCRISSASLCFVCFAERGVTIYIFVPLCILGSCARYKIQGHKLVTSTTIHR